MADPVAKKEAAPDKVIQTPVAKPQPGKPLPEGVKSSVEDGIQKLGAIRQQLGWPQLKPAQTPASATPSQQPTNTPPSASLGLPVKPTEQPAQPTGQPGQPAPAKTDATKETASEFQAKLQKDAGSAKTADLPGKIFEALAGLMGSVKNLDFFKNFSFGEKAPEPIKKSTGEKFTEEQLKKMALDLAKNKDKVYPSHDKAVEYVATVLNLPIRETAQKLLDSLTDSGMVFDQSMDNMKNLEAGDVLFFKKSDEKGEPFAYTCAVVTSAATDNEPLKMRIVPDGGGAPQEMSVKESDYFKNSWYGFVKTKNYAPESKP